MPRCNNHRTTSCRNNTTLRIIMATFLAPPLFWDQVEPPPGNQPEGRAPHRCYSKQLKVDLLPGTFVVIAATPANASASWDVIVARIVKAVGGTSTHDASFLIEVNIFRKIEELGRRREGGSETVTWNTFLKLCKRQRYQWLQHQTSQTWLLCSKKHHSKMVLTCSLLVKGWAMHLFYDIELIQEKNIQSRMLMAIRHENSCWRGYHLSIVSLFRPAIKIQDTMIALLAMSGITYCA